MRERMKLAAVATLVCLLLVSSINVLGGSVTWDKINDVIVSGANESSEQAESHLIVRGNNDNQLAAALMDDTNNAAFQCRAYSSSDGAQSWSDRGFLPLSPGTTISNDPVVASDTDGNFFIVCLATNASRDPWDLLYYFSANGGSSWSGPTDVVTGSGGIYHDKPWITADTRDVGSPYRDNVYVCWTEIDTTPSTDTTKIKFKRIWPDAGPIRQVATGNRFTQDPGTGEIQHCQVTVGVDGIIYVTWQRLNNPTIAKIQLKRSFDGGESFESFVQTVITFNRFPKTYGTCPPVPQDEKLWGCLKGTAGSGIQAPAIHSTAIDNIAWSVHVAYSNYDATTIADIRYTQGTNCITPGVPCVWATSQKIVKDGNVVKDQFDPAIIVSPDTYTIHVTAMDRRNSADNTAWQPWHYHCHFTSSDCTSSANWFVTGISSMSSSNFDGNTFVGHYHGITSSVGREADTAWTDTRIYLFNQDRNLFGDRLI